MEVENRVRRATEPDFAEWLRLRMSLWPEPREAHEEEMRHFSGRDDFAVFLVEQAPRGVVGFVEVSLRPYVNGCTGRPVAFVEGIWVDPPGRGKGAGRALIEACEAWAREKGVRELASDTLIDNRSSLIAHQAWGFTETERVVYLRKTL